MAIVAVCTQADIIAELTEATLAEVTDDASGAVVNGGLVEAKILEWSAFIWSKVRKRGYTLPTTESGVPTELRMCGKKLVSYDLLQRRNYNDENRKAAVEAVYKFLDDVQEGRAILDLARPNDPSPSAIVAATKPQVFNDEFFSGY